MNPRILGVRHHSPACAHRVERQIRKLRPAYVLIEGPADFNERLDELHMPHCLPVAIYSYLSTASIRRGSWTPFAAHSPEWRALIAGRETGATVRFIDLPAWHDAFTDLENRYADTVDAEAEHGSQTYHAALGKKLGVEGYDALWDRLFEDRAGDNETEPDELDSGLDTYFINLRADTPGSLGNQARERMMAQWIRWAMEQTSGPVVVVCGGYHAPALSRLWREMPVERPDTPLPSVAGEDAEEFRYGSYLVPYTFKRLDAFTGYASGMPSPAYYQWLWENGADYAGHELLSRVMRRLRDKKLPASTADMIAVYTSAQALARLRGHKQPLRVDWLDAITGAMVKDALSVPLPWTYRGTLLPGTDPVLVQVMDVLAGDVVGCLAPDTPQPPLVSAVNRELETAGINLHGSLTLDLFNPAERAKSRILHRLAILAIPGINRVSGPDLAMEGEARESWQLSRPMTQHAALIEAGSWGASLEAAASSCLEADIRTAAGNIETLASALNRAAFAGLNSLSNACIENLQNGIGQASRFEPLGAALSTLHTLLRHGQMLDMADAPMLAAAVEAAFDRALWLFELPGTVAPAELAPHISGVEAIVRICADVEARRHIDAGAQYLPLIEPERGRSVLRRKSGHPDAGPVSRGAALGGLLALDDDMENSTSSPRPDLTAQALTLLENLTPAQMGDALAGMVALAREVLVRNPSFLSGLDRVIRDLDDGDFIVALPAMRGALAWLPTQERGALAEAVLRLHDAGHLSKRALTAPMLKADAESLAAAGLAEKKALARLAEWGFFL